MFIYFYNSGEQDEDIDLVESLEDFEEAEYSESQGVSPRDTYEYFCPDEDADLVLSMIADRGVLPENIVIGKTDGLHEVNQDWEIVKPENGQILVGSEESNVSGWTLHSLRILRSDGELQHFSFYSFGETTVRGRLAAVLEEYLRFCDNIEGCLLHDFWNASNEFHICYATEGSDELLEKLHVDRAKYTLISATEKMQSLRIL